MKKTLVIHGHRKPDASQFGRALFEHACQLEQVSGHTLMQEYPDFKIDVALEQQRLTQYQALVLQFPFYWYSSPAIVKEGWTRSSSADGPMAADRPCRASTSWWPLRREGLKWCTSTEVPIAIPSTNS